jgi:Zn-dependent metalloprotease
MTTLALALVLGAASLSAAPGAPPLSKGQLAVLEAQRPALVARAQSELLGLRNQLHLGEETGFMAQQPFTNPQGRTVARFTQTFLGRRVWGGEAIVHVEPEGKVQTLTTGVKPSVALATPGPSLGADEAKAIALRNLAPKGKLYREPKVEALVFPTQFSGGIATRFDPEKKAMVWDKEMSLYPRVPKEPYVWAYEVSTLLMNAQDGTRAMCYIIDGTTGAILRKWNDIQHDTPAQGTGHSYLRGTVPLSTALAADGTYSLNALNRGSLPHPALAENGITQIGLTTYFGAVDYQQMILGFAPYAGHAGNTWGDGTIIPFPYDFETQQTLLDFSADGNTAWLRGALTPQGETSAVDAHYGVSTTWDFYKNLFNRDGIDNKGTSPLAVVHYMFNGGGGPLPYYDNAFWLQGAFGMFFGTGSRELLYPGGAEYLVELDIVGHEVTHGVCRAAIGDGQGLIYRGLSGGLNEANSDILGKMVQAYADGGAQGANVPEFPTADLANWGIGRHWSSTGLPLRYMYKPSLDGASADGLYDGLELEDVHFSSGPLNRMFYFLSQGASSSASAVTYSPYLPMGMTGIGNDKATRIWYKTLTEHLNPDSDYAAARAGAIQSAQELFGEGSPEVAAVMRAFSAINVGLAPGQAPRP